MKCITWWWAVTNCCSTKQHHNSGGLRPSGAYSSANARTRGNRLRRAVEALDRKARRRFIDAHEFRTLGRWNHVVNIIECAATTLINHVEQAKWARATIAQNEVRDGPA